MTPFLLVCVVLHLFFLPLSLSKTCSSHDERVLLQIKTSLNNPKLLSSWLPNHDCCTNFSGVECSPNGHRVKSLVISSGDISGQISDQVGDLPFLETLEFSDLPNLTGTIPHTIYKLKNLQLLRITRTSLTGSVPEFLNRLKSLTFLDLSYNMLSGSIPGSLSVMTKLEAIQLNDNKLTGSIPDSFGFFKGSTPNLYLFRNKLSGRIPASLSKLNFNAVDLSENKFIGDASMLFGKNKSTVRVNISMNMFEFDLSKFIFSKSLLSLDLSHNKIYGRLSRSLTTLRKLEHFDVSYNKLCDKIPAGGRLQKFPPSAYDHNKCLCGAPLPPCQMK